MGHCSTCALPPLLQGRQVAMHDCCRQALPMAALPHTALLHLFPLPGRRDHGWRRKWGKGSAGEGRVSCSLGFFLPSPASRVQGHLGQVSKILGGGAWPGSYKGSGSVQGSTSQSPPLQGAVLARIAQVRRFPGKGRGCACVLLSGTSPSSHQRYS